ncbi:MscS family membrane protein [Kushneria sinocarnis]|uniref:MscS family membrane protein n=1 Tax=Kushneria sinocarnis TaxID=595502 RepID=A0A420X070_9GAMM|nr:mechanosensitive ion channel family protein [Kushneria sinocarnis]RKR06859.1 MscS family membrane protein [Kushneria sinocarnis]
MTDDRTGLAPIESLQESIDGTLSLPGWVWMPVVTIVVALVLDTTLYFVLARLERRLNRSGHRWDDALIHGIRRPFRLWVWLTVITILASVLGSQLHIGWIEHNIATAQGLLTLAAIGWAGIRLISRLEKRLVFPPPAGRARPVDPTSASAITKIIGALLLTALTLMALQLMGFSISSLLALGGFGGLVIGFATRDLIANFFSGMVIYIDKPFVVGDWVKSTERDIEGVVEDIGWRLTTIRTFAGPPIYVPNAVFNQIIVENPTRMFSRRLWETVGIHYEDIRRVREITGDIRRYLMAHERIDQQELITVNFVTFGDYALELMIYAFTVPTDWQTFQELKQEILIRISEIIEEHGATLAIPTSRLRLNDADMTLRHSADPGKGVRQSAHPAPAETAGQPGVPADDHGSRP